MADMGEGEWKKMLCVEAGRVVEPVNLKPAGSFQASQTIKIIKWWLILFHKFWFEL